MIGDKMQIGLPASADLWHPRRSGCAEASRSAQLARVRAMTVAQRIEAALSMKTRFRDVRPVPMPGAAP